MANLPNAKKAIRVHARKEKINKKIKIKVKRLIKETQQAVEANNPEEAQEKMRLAHKALDKAAKRYMHENKAARLKSKLAKKVNSIKE